MPRVVLFVEPSPYPSYGGSKRVLTEVFAVLDRSRWSPRAIFCSDGPYVEDARRLEVPVHVIDAGSRSGSPSTRPQDLEAGARRDALAHQVPLGPGRLQRAGVRNTDQGDVVRHGPRHLVWEARAWYRLLIGDRRAGQDLRAIVPAGVDLMHINAPLHAEYAWYHLARACGIPFVTHEHRLWRRPPSAWRVVARDAAAVLCLTPERVEQVRRFCGRSVMAEFLPNGISLQRFAHLRPRAEVRQALGVGLEEFLLVTAGHVQPWKGHHLALEAAYRLRDAGLPFRWIFCGRRLDTSYAAAIESAVAAANLSDRFRFVEERPDLPDILAAADLAVHTSVHPEPFGLVVVEAMAAGTPVVGPAEGAIPMILGDGEAGRTYQPRDASSLAEAVLQLARNPDAMRIAGERGRRRVAELFQVEDQALRLMAIYDRAMERRSHR